MTAGLPQPRWLQRIETLGNRLPHPTLLFVWLCLIVLVLSWLLGLAGFSATHPVTHEAIAAVNLLSRDGLHRILQNTVTNFTQFAPVGTVLVAMLGLGVAERSGLLGAMLKRLVGQHRGVVLTLIVVYAGVMSSIAADAGYVVLIPLAGLLFASAGKHPLAGMAAAFAGVSGGYAANMLVSPLDAVLAGITTEAVHLVDKNQDVSVLANYWFIIASTLLITLLCTWITHRITLPSLPQWEPQDTFSGHALSAAESRGLKTALIILLVMVALVLAGLVPEHGILRDPATGSIVKSPFISGIVTLIALTATLCGVGFGICTGRYQNRDQIIKDMEDTLAGMATYLVLMFFAAQFVNYFSWSNIGMILAIKGSNTLQAMAVPGVVLLLAFILMAASINLLIGSASAMWSLMAPVFIPMFLLAGIAPESVQAAYRIGDSSTNIISPLMPYFGVVVAFMQRYKPDLGIGTMLALMLPYSLTILVGWSALFALWYLSGIPFGVY